MKREANILSGRSWLWRNEYYHPRITFEWNLLWKARSCHASITCNGCEDRGLLIAISIPFLLSIYLGLDFAWINKLMPTATSTYLDPPRPLPVEREIRFAIHHGALWWSIWCDPHSWSCDIPRWRSGNFNPMDFLFGKQKHSEEELSTGEETLRMPEGDYQATYRTYVSTWRRPRWPLRKSLERITIDYTPAVPIPGKGTTSYNCDDDATYGVTKLLDECGVIGALRKERKSIIETRLVRGGPRWKPRGGWPVSVEPVDEEAIP